MSEIARRIGAEIARAETFARSTFGLNEASLAMHAPQMRHDVLALAAECRRLRAESYQVAEASEPEPLTAFVDQMNKSILNAQESFIALYLKATGLDITEVELVQVVEPERVRIYCRRKGSKE